MINYNVDFKADNGREDFLSRLIGGTSLRVPEEIIPDPESILKIHKETLQRVDNLSLSRNLDYHQIWERALFIIDSQEIVDVIESCKEVMLSEEKEPTTICQPLLVKIKDMARKMNIPIDKLLFASVLKLEELLHDADAFEYATVKSAEEVLLEVGFQLENLEVQYLDNNHDIIGLVSDLIEAARENVDIALLQVNSYLSAHAFPPTDKQSGI